MVEHEKSGGVKPPLQVGLRLVVIGLVLIVVGEASRVLADEPAKSASAATIKEKTAGAEKLAGFFNLYWDAKAGKLWLEVDKFGAEFLYQTGLAAGVGSNDIGLDRGQPGPTRLVRFERSGPKVLLVQENLEYRAITNDVDEARAVKESFAESALWGF